MIATGLPNMKKNNVGNNTISMKNVSPFSNLSFTKPPSLNATTEKANSLSDLYSPVMESVTEAMNNSDMMSVPVMIGIGILIILLIIVTIFRDHIAYGLQVAWNAIVSLFQKQSDAPPSMPSDQSVDQHAIQQIVPSVKEVFNIADNKYKYSDAEPLCKAYGAELATYDQVKDAWNKGADWCNYGWVKGQAAIYPTQEETYKKLQAGPEDQKGACGITGINGGYFDNPDLRFGVNCYGNKPGKTDADERAQMKPRNMTNDALEYDRKVQEYKHDIYEIPISPFSPNKWA